MRDPRPGFAEDQRCVRRRSAGKQVGIWVVSLTLCACGGAAVSSAPPGVVPAPDAPVPAAPVAGRSRVVSLSYAAPADCPDVDGYSSHVRTRSSTLSFEPGGVTAPDSVDVKVDPAPDASGWVGHLTIAGTQALDREVRGERCEDVVAALALITVLRLEGADASGAAVAPTGASAGDTSVDITRGAGTAGAGTASAGAGDSAKSEGGTPAARADSAAPVAPDGTSRPANEPSTSAPVPASEEPPAAASAPAPEADGRDGRAASESAASTEQRAETQAREERRVESRARAEHRALDERRAAAAGAGSDIARAGAPERRARASTESVLESSPTGSGDASVDQREAAHTGESWQWPRVTAGVALQGGYASVPAHAIKGLLQGELRFGEGVSRWASTLSLAYAHGTREVEVATLGITLITAELALCPPAFIDATRVWLRACAGVRGGGVHFVVTANDPSQDPGAAWRPWLAVGPALQLGVPLADRWALRGVFDLALQLIRDRFNIARQVESMGAEEQLTLYRPEAISFELGLALGYTF